MDTVNGSVIQMVRDDLSPSNSSLFTTWTDPHSGVTSFLFDPPSIDRSYGFSRPATNVTTDGNFVWLYVAEVNDPTTSLSVADLRSDSFTRVEPRSPADPSPAVDVTTGTAFVASGHSVFACRVEDAGEGTGETVGSRPRVHRRQVGTFDASEQGPGRLVSGLTRSVDGDRLCGLFERNGTYRVTSLYLPTGDTDVWHSRSEPDDVIQFSPTDPTLVLLARDAEHGGDTGATTGFGTGSVWLAREGLGARPLDAHVPNRHRSHWWDPDGAGLWYVEPGTGVGVLDLETGHRRTVWSAPVTNAHATRDGRLLAAVVSRDGHERLQIYDSSTESVVDVVSRFDSDWERRADSRNTPDSPRPPIRANPRFVAGDSLLAYTTTVPSRDGPAFAFTPVEHVESRL